MRPCSLFVVVAALVLAGLAGRAEAADQIIKVKIAEAMKDPEFKSKLGDRVTFHFGKERRGKSLGEFVSNKKTRLPQEQGGACRRALLSALLQFKDPRAGAGGDTVSGLVSYYDKSEFVSATEVECHAGAMMAGVALKGYVSKTRR
jgi:hypothetical protein